jgi:signal transduction histidine kinase
MAERTLTGRLADLTRGVLGCSRVAISTVEDERLVLRQMAITGLDPEQEREWVREHEQRPEQTLGDGLSADLVERLKAGETLALDLTKPPYNSTPNRYGTTAALVTPMTFQGRLVGLLVLDFLEQGPDGRQQPHQFTREEIQLAEAVARLGAVVLERERLLQEREATRARTLALEEANRRMDEFIGIAGHELRTPLTSVKANLQLAERRARNLADGPADRATSQNIARLVHLLSNAVNGVERQERLVRDLLDISRISSGKLTYRMAPCDLTALTREITQELLLTAPGREMRVILPDAPVMAQADADRVGQVLTNYLTNALKYSPSNHPITVTLRHDETQSRIEVADEGPGLTNEQQRGLFERFHRVEGIEAQHGSGVGLGLGLYISRMIVERHGGEVGVASAPGEGTTFWFTLPLLAL